MERQPNTSRLAAQAGLACACFNLRKAARAVTQLYDEMLRGTGLRSTQFTLLMLVAAKDQVSVTDLANMAVMDRTTLTRNLRLLERRGFVQVRPGEDRRVREVALTRKGHGALTTAFPLWEKAQAQVASKMGQARVDRLLSDLTAAVKAAGVP